MVPRRGHLNKHTAEKPPSLAAQLEAEVREAPGPTSALAAEIQAKACHEHTHQDDTFVELYAQLCAKLHAKLGKKGEAAEEAAEAAEAAETAAPEFRAALLEECRVSFERLAEPPALPEEGLSEEGILEEQLKH